jgi:predicted RNA-binding Zn-ribbon protein involved in translation (DUF1610 family)
MTDNRFTTRKCANCGKFHWLVTAGRFKCDRCGDEVALAYV